LLESRVVPEINFRRNSRNSIFAAYGSLGGFSELSASVLAFLLDVNCAVTSDAAIEWQSCGFKEAGSCEVGDLQTVLGTSMSKVGVDGVPLSVVTRERTHLVC